MHSKYRVLLPLLCALVPLACGDSSNADPDTGVTDAAPDAVANPDACGPGQTTWTPQGRLVVATEQYGSGGGITTIDLDTLEPTINVAQTHDDVTIRWFDNKLWVLNRYGADNLMILDGRDFHLERQISVRPASNEPCNIHDLLFFSRCRAYLTCYEQSSLYIIDPTAPLDEVITGSIDLSALADVDGLPEISHMAQVEGLVYVALERLNRQQGWQPVPPSYLLVIDPTTDEVVGDITLATTNPVGPVRVIPGTSDLLLTTAGNWDGEDAGFERVDTADNTTEVLLTAADLGGIVAGYTLDETGCGFAVIMAPVTYDNALVSFCLDGGPASVETCIPMGEDTFTDIVQADDGRLFLSDTDYTNPGIRILDPDTCEEITMAPIPTGFSPGFTNPMLLVPNL